ncbi:MAG: hemolysin III family protein [Clostridia bacterium]|nr:hemolysin III family protein [Clostridia bacterium]
MKLQKVTLPTYTKGEEIFNAISHGLGIPLGILALIVCLLKASDVNTIVGSVVFALSVVVLYTCSTLYHSLKRSDAKKVMRILDHSTIFILITGTSIAMTVICVYPYHKVLAIVMSSLSFILSTVGTALTFIDQEKYKKAQMTLYMVVGWITVVLIYPIYKNCGGTIVALIAVGGIIYTVGVIFYAMGKKKKYFHSIFHLFVLCGTILHFLCIYNAI